MILLVLAGALLVAFVNGANDTMKGVATLYGSGALDHRRSLALAAASTLLGSLASIVLASGLVQAFSAKGLVPDHLLTPALLASAATAAGLTVLLATGLGLPVSTTHALLGALAGAGFVTAGPALNFAVLGSAFVLPLLVSPLLAVVLAFFLYGAGRSTRRRLGIEAESCLCVGEERVPVTALAPAAAISREGTRLAMITGPTAEACERRYVGSVAGISAHAAVTAAHVVSAGLVGFARGLNDTPKIVGLLAGASALSPAAGAVAVAAAMTAGGLLASRRVAETMAKRVTPMNEGQGLAGNVATSLLVTAASRFGIPVSTTHVATGGIFGIGAAGGGLRRVMAGAIVAAWVTTLPLAALLGAGMMWLLGGR